MKQKYIIVICVFLGIHKPQIPIKDPILDGYQRLVNVVVAMVVHKCQFINVAIVHEYTFWDPAVLLRL